MTVTKTATSNGNTLSTSSRIEPNAVIQYTNNAYLGNTSYLSSSDSAMPMVDKMSNGQLLLVPVSTYNTNKLNAQRQGSDGKTFTETLTIKKSSSGTEYYVLDVPGTYKGLLLSSNSTYATNGYADTVEVIAGSSTSTDSSVSSESGTVTMIYWYLTSYSNSVTYYALADPGSVSESGSFTLKDEVWLGDHESRRVYDYLTTGGTVLGSGKTIVSNLKKGLTDGANHNPSTDEEASYTFIEEGDSVTYRLTIATSGSNQLELTGSNMYDTLPNTLKTMLWEKNKNVSLTFVPASGTTVSYYQRTKSGDTTTDTEYKLTDGKLDDVWYLDGTTYSSGAAYQKIRFNSDFVIKLKGTLYIYVTLTYPSGDNWAAYCKQYGATTLTNTWNLYGLTNSVSHMLAEISEGAMVKSVLATGTEVSSTSTYSKVYSINDNTDRNYYYTNRTSKEGIVTYGITIYNSGSTRLYLTEVEDILPKGFTFYSLYYKYSGTTYAYHSYYAKSAYASYYSSLMGVTDANRTTSKQSYLSSFYRNGSNYDVYIKANAGAVNKDGQQTVTFTFYAGATNDPQDPYLYLNPGQRITIVYNCKTNGYTDTEDVADNKAVMRLYDYTGKGVAMNTNGITMLGKHSSTSILGNDGECLEVGASQVDLWGMDISHGSEDSKYLASSVTIYRGQVIPGISKVADQSYVSTTDAIPWTITAMNDGNGSLYDYTITDVMMSPYQFSGDVKYTIKAKDGSTMADNQTLFTVLKTSGNTVKLQEYNGTTVDWLTIGGDTLTLNTESLGQIQLRMDWNDDGDLTMSIRFLEEAAALMAGYQGIMKLQTSKDNSEHENKSYVNECYLTPNVQTFVNSSVTHGRFQYFNAEIDPDAPEAGTAAAEDYVSEAKPSVKGQAQVQVSYGYATTSIKSVTELDKSGSETTNSAKSTESTNSITLLNGSTSTFRYGTQVNSVGGTSDGGSDAPGMWLFVLVDNLPEVGDHMTMYERYSRDSEFKVDFAENLNPEVTVTYTETDASGNKVTVANTLNSTDYSVTTEKNGKTTTTEYHDKKLTTDDYVLQFSAKTDLDYENNKDVWQGDTLTEKDGWYTAEECTKYGIWHEMRTVRLVIKDETCNQGLVSKVGANDNNGKTITRGRLPDGATVEFFFNATVCNEDGEEHNAPETTAQGTNTQTDEQEEDDKKAANIKTDEPEEETTKSSGYGVPSASAVAWNSFGYLYEMGKQDENSGYLRAAPQVVGVRMPSAPTLTKELVDYGGATYEAEQDETFSFLIYNDKDRGLDASKTADELLDDLEALGLKATVVNVTVKKGDSSAEVELSNLYIYEKNKAKAKEAADKKAKEEAANSIGPAASADDTGGSGGDDQENSGETDGDTAAESVTTYWEASETDCWDWTDGQYYTVIELSTNASKEYSLLSLNGSKRDACSILYISSARSDVLAINQRISWSLSVTKRSSEDGSPLAGAMFGLYTRDKSLAITNAATYQGIAATIEVPVKSDDDADNASDSNANSQTEENGGNTDPTTMVDETSPVENQNDGEETGSTDTTPKTDEDTKTDTETNTETKTETWYLMAVDTTDESGHARWNGLVATEEYLVEVVPPEGYLLNTEITHIEANWGSVVPATVEDDIDPEYFHLRVNKVWEDEGHEDERPESVTVTLRKNGVAVDQQQLSEANGWTYNWLGLTPTAEWTVTEDDVPSGYSASTTVDGRTVTITNTRDGSLFLPTVLLVGIPWLIEKLSQLLMDPTPLGDLSLTDPVSTPDETPQEVEDPGPVYQLPQTGLNRLPVWIMLGAGVALIAVGLYLNSKGRKGKHYAEKKDKKGQNPAQTPAEKPDEPDPTPQPPEEAEKQEEDPQIKP
jgi:hypothetical protein